MLAEHGHVDLVVSDVVMPEMDGPTLLREMRKRNPNLKIIFVSGYAEEAFVGRACTISTVAAHRLQPDQRFPSRPSSDLLLDVSGTAC